MAAGRTRCRSTRDRRISVERIRNMATTLTPEQLRTVIPTEQIQKRVREMARQISNDYQGKTIHALAVLENGFMFMSDLVRSLEGPVICQFIKPKYQKAKNGAETIEEIFFSHDADIRGHHEIGREHV